jgi:hypothetical protein
MINKEKKEYDKQYRVEHKQEINKKNKRYRIKHRKELNKKNRQYHANHIEEIKNSRKQHLYNITQEQYNELFYKQNGNCAICGKNQSELKKVLSVDHNHITGKVRGLLCSKCNFGIGNLNDDINMLTQAIIYLKNND